MYPAQCTWLIMSMQFLLSCTRMPCNGGTAWFIISLQHWLAHAGVSWLPLLQPAVHWRGSHDYLYYNLPCTGGGLITFTSTCRASWLHSPTPAVPHEWLPSLAPAVHWPEPHDLARMSVRMSLSVTEFSEVLPPFFPPPTFSSVRVGGVVVVVGCCGGTDSGT